MTQQAYLTQLEQQWLPGLQLHCDLCRYTAGKGWLTALHGLRHKGAAWDKWICSAAAQGGHMAVLQWSLGQECLWSTQNMIFGPQPGAERPLGIPHVDTSAGHLQ